jgi:hypothetical protein
MRGRPPLRPFLRAAAAFAGEDFRPPTRPSSASHSGPANTEEKRPGTLRSRSRLSQCKPPPRPSISTPRTSRGGARLRLGISLTGRVMTAPFVSSIRSARCGAKYVTELARVSVLAARRPARHARAKFERSSASIHFGIVTSSFARNQTLGLCSTQASVPNSSEASSRNCPSYCSSWWAVLGSNQWPPAV